MQHTSKKLFALVIPMQHKSILWSWCFAASVPCKPVLTRKTSSVAAVAPSPWACPLHLLFSGINVTLCCWPSACLFFFPCSGQAMLIALQGDAAMTASQLAEAQAQVRVLEANAAEGAAEEEGAHACRLLELKLQVGNSVQVDFKSAVQFQCASRLRLLEQTLRGAGMGAHHRDWSVCHAQGALHQPKAALGGKRAVAEQE